MSSGCLLIERTCCDKNLQETAEQCLKKKKISV